MGAYEVLDTSTNKSYWCIAIGPANALRMISAQRRIRLDALSVFNTKNQFLGRWGTNG